MWRRWAILCALILVAAGAWAWTRGWHSNQDIEAAEIKRLNANPAAQAAHQQGESAWERGDHEEARRGFETAARLEPASAMAHLNLGMVQLRLHRQQDAVQTLRRAVTLQPQWEAAWRQLGKAYGDVGQLPEAVEATRRATRLNSKSPEAWMERARASLLKADMADAEQSARQAVNLTPDRGDVWLSLGDVLLRVPGNQRLAEAISAYQRANSIAPSSYGYRRQGDAEQRAGRAEAAVRSLREAVRLAPLDASCAYQLSVALQSVGQTAERERWATRARKLQEDRYRLAALERKADQNPEDVRLQVQLAQQFARMDERWEAMQAYRRALAMDPTNQTARDALAQLEAGAAR